MKLREAMLKSFGNERDTENKFASLSGLIASSGTKRQSSISQWQRNAKSAKTGTLEKMCRRSRNVGHDVINLKNDVVNLC